MTQKGALSPRPDDVGMESTTGDLSLFCKREIDEMGEGIIYLYVDDSISARTREFEDFSKNTEQRFDSKPMEVAPFTFARIGADKIGNTYNLQQAQYINRINSLSSTTTFDSFRSLRHQLA